MLAWTLALLVVPALASACTNTFTGHGDGTTWEDTANWDGGLPTKDEVICIPSPQSVTIASPAEVGDLVVQSGGTLTVSALGLLSVGGGTTSGQSTVDGALAVDGTMKVQEATLTVTKSPSVTGSLTVTAGANVDVSPGIGFTGGGNLNVDSGATLHFGSLETESGTAPASVVDVNLNDNGVVSSWVPVQLVGGGNGNGDWNLGSGDPPPTLTIATKPFQLNGTVSDIETGGGGQLVVNSTLTMTNGSTDPHIYVNDLEVLGAGATLDFSPLAPIGTSAIGVSNLTVSNAGGGGLFEVDAPMQVYQVTTLRQGAMLDNGTWDLNTFHFGGGDIASATGGPLNVAGLDMYVDAASGDSGTLSISGKLVFNMNGAAYDGVPTINAATGGFTLNGTTVFHVGTNAHLWFGDDSNIDDGNPTGTSVVNDGIIDKRLGSGAGSLLQPQLTTANGQLWVGKSTKLTLGVPPDTLAAGKLTGTYVLDGPLDVVGPVNQLAGQFQFGASGTIVSGATDFTTTLTSNGAGSTITVQKNATVTNGFTNNGVIDVQAGSTLTAGSTYAQATGGVTKVNGTLDATAAGLTVSGGTLQGSGTIAGNVTNAFGGTVAPGNSPGLLTINGNFTNNGVLLEEINGPAGGTDYDQINVTGTATLGGQLILQRTGGYLPPNGQAFDAITAANIVGTFGTITQFPAGSDTWFEPSYGGTLFRLTANSVSVGDATVAEGNSGTTNATVTVALGQASSGAVSVDWATQDGSATAGSDYSAASGTVNFAPGETTKTVTVAVTGDTTVEPDENFAVNLANPVGTRIRDGQGVGTITNDDGPPVASAAATRVAPGDIDGFAVAPPPIQGKAVNVEPVSGKVLVKLPGTTKFVPLPDAEQVPVGTIVDATKGTVRLYSVGKNGRIQSALFYEGIFQVTQKRAQALTVLKLVGGSFAACPRVRGATASATKRKKLSGKASVRHLWGSGSGQFRTQGRFAAATIRGTKWLTDDRCNGTLIQVAQGAVTVNDLTLRKTLALKAPKSYLAPAVKPKRKH